MEVVPELKNFASAEEESRSIAMHVEAALYAKHRKEISKDYAK